MAELGIRISGVAKSFGDVRALRDVTLDVQRRDIVALVGANGAGKTTLLSLCASLRQPDAGTIELMGHDVAQEPARVRALVGVAEQQVALYPSVSARRNLAFFARLRGVPSSATAATIESVSQRLALAGLLDRKVAHLSGGEQRRLHVAVAMLGDPPVLLLDEPTAGVDIDTRQLVIDAVRRAANDGATVLYCTHYLAEVTALDAHVVFIHDGRVLARGHHDDLAREFGSTGLEIVLGAPLPGDYTPPAGLSMVIQNTERTRIAVQGADAERAVPMLLGGLLQANVPVDSLRVERSNLETVYARLVHRAGQSRCPELPSGDSA